MTVSRAQFAGTALEGAAQWLLEIEALGMGGWKLDRVPMIPEKDYVARHQDKKKRGRAASVTPQFRVTRVVRITEPRAAPLARSHVRHHHFEVKTILPSRTDGKSVAVQRTGYIEAYGATDALIGVQARASLEAGYVEGFQGVDAERVVYLTATNGETYQDRMQFWQRANDNATFVGTHTVTISTHGVEDAWDRLARNPTMPDPLRRALAQARASDDGQAKIEVNDAGIVKRWMNKQKKFPDELRDNLSLYAPHNGRVAYAITGQFPHDLSLEGMMASLDKLMAEFERRGIPAEAVIHVPTVKNSIKNWHFHLVHYAGPAQKMADGRWSFEREMVRNQYRTAKWVPLKRMAKDKDVSSDTWIPKIKGMWRDIVNEQAKAEGIPTRFTNETNKARGLHKAQTRLSPDRQALRQQGFFTEDELARNRESWNAWREGKAKRFLDVVAPLMARHARLSGDVRAHDAQTRDELGQCQDVLGQIDDLIDQATRALMLEKAIVSGPKDMLAQYGGKRDALAEKPGTPKREANLEFFTDVCAVAERHLEKIAPVVERLGQIKHKTVEVLTAMCRSLDQHMGILETRIIKASTVSGDNLSLLGAEHDEGRRREPSAPKLDAGVVVDLSRARPIAGADEPEAIAMDDRLARPHDKEARALDDGEHVLAQRRNLELLYQALAAERVLLMPKDTRRIVPDPLLKRFSLSAADVLDTLFQLRLEDIASAQMEEIAPVADYVQRHPGMVRSDRNGWRIDAAAPDDIKNIAANWSHDPAFQTALRRIEASQAAERERLELDRARSLAHAAAQRRRHTSGWVASMRIDLASDGRQYDVERKRHGSPIAGVQPERSRQPRRFPPSQDFGR